MYRWAQSDARGDRPASSRGAEFLDSSTAFDDAPFPADAPGPWGTKGQPTVPKKAPRSAASVLSKFRDSRLQQGMPTRRAVNRNPHSESPHRPSPPRTFMTHPRPPLPPLAASKKCS